jgi:hypothetical protein
MTPPTAANRDAMSMQADGLGRQSSPDQKRAYPSPLVVRPQGTTESSSSCRPAHVGVPQALLTIEHRPTRQGAIVLGRDGAMTMLASRASHGGGRRLRWQAPGAGSLISGTS